MDRTLLAAVCAGILLAAPAAFAQSTTSHMTPNKTAASLAFPVCDQSHTDHCIELGKHPFIDKLADQHYPTCATVKNVNHKAACIESSFKEQRHAT